MCRGVLGRVGVSQLIEGRSNWRWSIYSNSLKGFSVGGLYLSCVGR